MWICHGMCGQSLHYQKRGLNHSFHSSHRVLDACRTMNSGVSCIICEEDSVMNVDSSKEIFLMKVAFVMELDAMNEVL